MKKFGLLAAGLFLILCGPAAYAGDATKEESGKKWEKKEGGGRMGRMAEKLGLSEDQKAKLKAMHEKDGETWKKLGEEMRASIKALKEGVDKGAKDPELTKLIAGVEKARNNMRAQEDKNVQEMKKILTVPQQAKAALFFAHKAKDQRGRGGRGGKDGWKKERKQREHEEEDEDEGEEDDEKQEMKK